MRNNKNFNEESKNAQNLEKIKRLFEHFDDLRSLMIDAFTTIGNQYIKIAPNYESSQSIILGLSIALIGLEMTAASILTTSSNPEYAKEIFRQMSNQFKRLMILDYALTFATMPAEMDSQLLDYMTLIQQLPTNLSSEWEPLSDNERQILKEEIKQCIEEIRNCEEWPAELQD